MYMAEALVATDRIADAISHLNPEALTPADISTAPPEAKADPGWFMILVTGLPVLRDFADFRKK